MNPTKAMLPAPGVRELKSFSRTLGIAFALFVGVLLPFLFTTQFKTWPFVVGGLLVLWGELLPLSLRPVYAGWFRLGLALSRITQPVILAIVFFGVVTPMGWVRRKAGASRIVVKLDQHAESYRAPPQPSTRFEDPF